VCAFLLLARSSHICSQLARAPHDRRSTWAGGVGGVVVVVDFPRMKSPSTSRRTTGMYDPNRHCWSSFLVRAGPGHGDGRMGAPHPTTRFGHAFSVSPTSFFFLIQFCARHALSGRSRRCSLSSDPLHPVPPKESIIISNRYTIYYR
jgi:hypothetical protein